MNFQLQTLMQQIDNINDKTCSEEQKNESQHSSYFSSPLPTWSSTPLHNQQSEKVSNFPNSGMDKEQFTPNRRISSEVKLIELAPDEFSLEDVQQMQKVIKELYKENLQKTMSCIKLEQTCNSLKEEIASLKHEDFKQKDNSESYLMEISKSPADVSREEKLLRELNESKLRNDSIQREEFRLRELVAVYEERFEYFLKIVSNTTAVFAENKKILDATVVKIHALESEIATWKERENQESDKKKMLHSLVEEMFGSSNPNSLR